MSLVSRFFAILGLMTMLVGLALWVLLAVSRKKPSSLLDEISPYAWWLIAAVATTTMLGSLYYSEVQGYTPCELCWAQRAFVYPLAFVALFGAIKRPRKLWMLAAAMCAIGAVIAAYHTQLQAYPEQKTFCSTKVPCTVRYVWEFGFVSLPLLALCAFVFCGAMAVVVGRSERAELVETGSMSSPSNPGESSS